MTNIVDKIVYILKCVTLLLCFGVACLTIWGMVFGFTDRIHYNILGALVIAFMIGIVAIVMEVENSINK